MNRREMMKTVAAVAVGGPAAIEAARRAEALALYRPLEPLVRMYRVFTQYTPGHANIWRQVSVAPDGRETVLIDEGVRLPCK